MLTKKPTHQQLLTNSIIMPYISQNEQLLHLINQYENQEQKIEQLQIDVDQEILKQKQKQRKKQTMGTKNSFHEKLGNKQQKINDQMMQVNNISEVCIETINKINNQPLRMFKDKMQLIKQNTSKKQIVKQLEDINKKLKHQYDGSLNNNKKMEMFLKQIQFIFKNDRSNQKANETLLKATKTLHRQKQQSKNYIQKLVKKVKTNEMRELKMYLKVLESEKNRLHILLNKQIQENQKLRKQQDFNNAQMQNFQFYQQIMTHVLSAGLQDSLKIRENYKKQKSMIKISLSCKEVEYIKRQINSIDEQIRAQLLHKQGLQYQIYLLKSRTKQKNKRNMKQQGSILKQQIKKKHKKIISLQQQLKSKIKTQQYITKYTKQLRIQLQSLKENHLLAKQKYQEEINKLSRDIEDWNRKYKAELIEEQNIGKKGQIVKESLGKGDGVKGIERGVRVVKFEEIDKVRKRIVFWFIQKMIDGIFFVKEKLLGNSKSISLKQLNKRLRQLQALQNQQAAQIFKLSRYIIQDNNQTYSKINQDQTIECSLALLILKNLLSYPLTYTNISITGQQLHSLLTKNYDEIRHQIWLNSAKSPNFTLVNLKYALSKYVSQECEINKYMAYFEYMIWKKFEEMGMFQLVNFQKVCEGILGKKLAKDVNNRISKTTIKSVFDSLNSRTALDRLSILASGQ